MGRAMEAISALSTVCLVITGRLFHCAEPEPATDRAMELAMIRLLEERAAKYAADQAVSLT